MPEVSVCFRVENPQSDAAKWCIAQYFAEIAKRFEEGFEAALSTSPDVGEFVAPRGCFVVGWRNDEPIACGAVKLHAETDADIKRMWVASSARGQGTGRELLGELERHAARLGATAVRLETNRALPEALALYRAAGFREVEPFNDELYAHHWFAKRIEPARE